MILHVVWDHHFLCVGKVRFLSAMSQRHRVHPQKRCRTILALLIASFIHLSMLT